MGFRISQIASLSNRDQNKACPKPPKLVGTNFKLAIYGSLGTYYAQLSTTIFSDFTSWFTTIAIDVMCKRKKVCTYESVAQTTMQLKQQMRLREVLLMGSCRQVSIHWGLAAKLREKLLLGSCRQAVNLISADSAPLRLSNICCFKVIPHSSV